MKVAIGTIVTYDVDEVEVSNIIISSHENNLVITAPYVWLDADGKRIRRGDNVYAESDLVATFAAHGQDFSQIVPILRSLIPTSGTSGNCNVLFADDGGVTAIKGYAGIDEGGKGKWFSEFMTLEQFTNAISPLTIEQVKQMVQMFTLSIFEDDTSSSSSSNSSGQNE